LKINDLAFANIGCEIERTECRTCNGTGCPQAITLIRHAVLLLCANAEVPVNPAFLAHDFLKVPDLPGFL
jgi:hypothetical protein